MDDADRNNTTGVSEEILLDSSTKNSGVLKSHSNGWGEGREMMGVKRQEASAVAVSLLVRLKPIETAQQSHLVSSAHHGTRRRFADNCRGIGGIVAHYRSD